MNADRVEALQAKIDILRAVSQLEANEDVFLTWDDGILCAVYAEPYGVNYVYEEI